LKIRIFTAIIAILFISTGLFAYDGNKDAAEESLLKHKTIISKAKDRDWKTYAECANAMVTKRICNTEILNWINKSISIKETVFNHVVKGDYFVVEGKITEAKNEYIRAIELAMKNGKEDEVSDIQWKILIAMGVENYNNFHSLNK